MKVFHFYIKVHRLLHRLNAKCYLKEMLKKHLQNISLQVYHLQGEQNAGLKEHLSLESSYL
jgi:hexokinase